MPEQRMDAVEAARAFVAARFPDCLAAFLAGSVVRGDATPTSDLDIIVVSDGVQSAYRESFLESGWPIEVFVHTRDSFRAFFASDAAEFQPSLARMFSEGLILRDTGRLAESIKSEARELLERGPEPLSPARQDAMRYHVTDLLDDFVGSADPTETLFIGASLAESAVELHLVSQGRWAGSGKWVPRALAQHDPFMAGELKAAMRSLATDGDKCPLTRFCETALKTAGGRLFEGYSAGKK